MATAILNSDGLEISSRIKFLKTHRYEVYGEVKEIEGEGVIVDLDFLVDDFGARDDKGTLWTTPCPSAVGEWSAGVEVAMKDLLILNRGNPLKIWVPGCARPLFCKNSDVINSYYFACGCENCSSDADIETIRLILEQLSVTKTSDMGEMLKFSDAFQDLVNRRKKLVKKFDVKMKQVVQKHFPKAEVCLYTRITAPFPGLIRFRGRGLCGVPINGAARIQGRASASGCEGFQTGACPVQECKRCLDDASDG
jgi:hypothetical protein